MRQSSTLMGATVARGIGIAVTQARCNVTLVRQRLPIVRNMMNPKAQMYGGSFWRTNA